MPRKYMLKPHEAAAIRAAMKERGIREMDVAHCLGVNVSTIYRNLSGKAPVYVRDCLTLYQALGCDTRVGFLLDIERDAAALNSENLPPDRKVWRNALHIEYEEMQYVFSRLGLEERLELLGELQDLLKKYAEPLSDSDKPSSGTRAVYQTG